MSQNLPQKSAPSDPSVDPSFLALHEEQVVFVECNSSLRNEFAGYAGTKKTQSQDVARSHSKTNFNKPLMENCPLIHANLPPCTVI